jgi:trimethylamine--corrinoid protein Co-methyltransferase
VDHIILFDNLDHIVSNQMDIWPHDIPMHTIHAEAIRAWYLNCHKSFGMGAYGVMATMDMMDMVELVMGGADQVRNQHPFLTIVSIQSPLSTAQIQLEGLMILAERGQPAIMSPEAMAGTTAPVTLAGLMVQHNAEVLSHIVMAQAVKPGAPVLYGSVSTIAEMRRGTVALGAVGNRYHFGRVQSDGSFLQPSLPGRGRNHGSQNPGYAMRNGTVRLHDADGPGRGQLYHLRGNHGIQHGRSARAGVY